MVLLLVMITNLTTSLVKQIFEIPKDEGWKLLSKQLDFGESDLQDDLRAASLVDYYYDILDYAAKRGMPWFEVVSCLKFANLFFEHIINDTLQEAIFSLHNLAVKFVEAGNLQINSAKKIVEFFVSTTLPNQKLYQFAYKNEQESMTFSHILDVETPMNSWKLKDAQPYAHWNYYQKLQKVKNQEQDNNLKISLKEETLNKMTTRIERKIDRKIQDKEYDNSDVNVDQAEKFLSSLVCEKLEMVKKSLEFEVEKMKSTTTNAIAVKAIPVPHGLELETSLITSLPKNQKSLSAKGRQSHSQSPRSPRPGKSSSTKKTRQ